MAGRVLLKIVYLLVRRILGLAVLLFRRDMAKDAATVMVAPVATDGRAGLASCHRCNGQPDSTRPRRARAEHDGGPAAGGRAAPAARPLALRDRTTAEGAPSITGGLGDVMAALQERGALPPLSPVPGQLATLCARLNLSGHAITTPPGRDLPEPWLSVLTQYQQRENRGGAGARRRRRRGRCPARTGRNPARSLACRTARTAPSCTCTPAARHVTQPTGRTNSIPGHRYVWICDSGGRWHATRTSGQSGLNGEIALRLK